MSKTNEKKEPKQSFQKGEELYNSIKVAPCTPTEKYLHLFAGAEGETINLKPSQLKGITIFFTDVIIYDLIITSTDADTGEILEVTHGKLIRLYDRVQKATYYTTSSGLTMALQSLVDTVGAPILTNTRLAIELIDKEFMSKKTNTTQRTYGFVMKGAEPYTENIAEEKEPICLGVAEQEKLTDMTEPTNDTVDAEYTEQPKEPQDQDPQA